MGLVRFAKSREVKGQVLHATIRRHPSGKYFISILAKIDIQPLEKTESAIGIDLGIRDFAILSDGQKVDNHRFTAKMEKKLKREQRKKQDWNMGPLFSGNFKGVSNVVVQKWEEFAGELINYQRIKMGMD